MSTLTLNKGGSIIGSVGSNQATARDVTTGTSIIQDASSTNAVQYFKSSGRVEVLLDIQDHFYSLMLLQLQVL